MFNLSRSISNTEIPMVSFDDGVKHLEFEFFDDRIEVFYLNRTNDHTHECEFVFDETFKKILKQKEL